MAAGRGDRGDARRRQPGVPDGLPQGRRARSRGAGSSALATAGSPLPRRGLRLRLRAARPRRPADQRQRRHRRLQRDRLRLPDAAGLPRRDRRPLPRRRHRRVRPRRQRGRRRARRAGDQAADAVDAGEASGTTRTTSATAPRTSTSTRASGARATGCGSASRAPASSPAARTRRSTAAASGWGRASSTRSSRSSPRSRTASSCTSRTTRAARASCVLFVVADLDDDCAGGSRARCARELSPRHVPDTIAAVPAIPRTLTGKKLEAPVKRILRGRRADTVASRGALAGARAPSMLSCSSARRGGGDDGRTASARRRRGSSARTRRTAAAILRSEMALEPYEASLGVLLRRWARGGAGPRLPGRAARAGRRLGRADLGRGGRARRTPSRRRCSTAGSGPKRPVMILSGNSIDHALLTLGALPGRRAGGAGLARLLADEPGLRQGQAHRRADQAGARVRGRRRAVRRRAGGGRLRRRGARALPGPGRDALRRAGRPRAPTGDVDEALAAVGPDSVAKILFTSRLDGDAQGRHQHARDAVRQPAERSRRSGRSRPRRRRCSSTGCRGTTRSAATTTST